MAEPLGQAAADPQFRADVLAGLGAPIPAVPARWLYDRRGSELFEAITELPEYYPTRVERAILERHCPDVARIAGTGHAVVEFGSGSSAKTPILLRAMKDTLGVGAFLLIGMDRIKDEEMLIRAYDDAAGVTAAFNINLLHRINGELDGNIPVEAFRHRAIWNDRMSRIEMHLEAVRDVEFTVSGTPFRFAEGETIHTENSHKYGLRDARLLLRAAGWGVCNEWTDEAGQFALILAEAEAPRFAP